MSRKKNSLLNASSSIMVYFLKTIFAFATRTVFIYMLGKDYLGLDSLILGLVSMLSIAEMGIGSAISFSLYKPLAENNFAKISAIMSLYKKAYFFVAFIILIFGFILSAFLPSIVGDVNHFNNIYLIFYLYIINTSLSYLISYKDVLLGADQKLHKITKYSISSVVALSTLQIIILFSTRNYILYLVTGIVVNLCYRVIVNIYINRNYADVSFRTKAVVSQSDKKSILKNVKALFLHKIGDYVINGTDSIIIAKFVGISTVGIYSNYLIIVTMAGGVISQAFNAITSSLGDLLNTKDNEKKYRIFEQMNIFNFIISGLSSLLIAVCINDFIFLWIGPDYVLGNNTTILISVSYFLNTMRTSSHIAKSAAGLFDIDKYTPIMQSIINLAASLILVGPLGLNGVIIGTIISSLALPSWQRPFIAYKVIFKKSSKIYFLNYIKYVIILILSYLILISIGNRIELMFNNALLILLSKLIITVIVFIGFIAITCRNDPSFKDVAILIKAMPSKLFKGKY